MSMVTIRRALQVLALSVSTLLVGSMAAHADPTPAAPTPDPPRPGQTQRSLGATEDDEIDPTWEFRSRVATNGPGDHLAVEFANVATAESLRRVAPDTSSWACPTGVWVLRMTRQLNFVSSASVPLCSEADATALDARLKVANEKEPDGAGREHNEMVIVNSINRAPAGKALTLEGLPAALGRIGVAEADFAGVDLSTTAFSAWGVPGMAPGQGYAYRAPAAADAETRVGELSPAGIKGGFLEDSRENFALEVSDFRVYDIDASGGITLNRKRFPVPVKPAGFKGGFHVMVFDNRTLDVISDRLYSTNSDPAGFIRFGDAMARLADTADPSVVVMLASVGDPVPDATKPGPLDLQDNCTYGTAFAVTCRYTPTDENERGSEQTFVIPDSPVVKNLRVRLQGGHGGGANNGGVGGRPAQVSAVLPVDGTSLSGGQTLYVEVGGHGADGARNAGGVGGYNGGGTGGAVLRDTDSGWPGGGGGGASDIRTLSASDDDREVSLETRRVVAAGGGGAGGSSLNNGDGGAGGQAGGDGAEGQRSGSEPVGGGGQSGTSIGGGAGGSGQRPGAPGRSAQGGGGVNATRNKLPDGSGAGGGGGGGLFGGGQGGNNFVPKNGGGGGGGGGGSSLVPVNGSVRPVTVDEPAFVEISYTTPTGTLADVLRPFGSTPTVIQQLAKYPRYALVGRPASPAERAVGQSPDSPEASGMIYAGATGRLQGVLQPGHDGEFDSITSFAPFRPRVGDKDRPEVNTSYDLYDIRSNVDQEWTVPAEGNAGQAAAFAYLSQKSCGCDNIRTYYKAQQETLADWRSTISGASFSSAMVDNPTPTFDEASFTAVRTALLSELADAIVVHGMAKKLEVLLTEQNLFATSELKQVYEKIRKSLEPPKKDEFVTAVIGFMLEIFGVAGELTGAGEVVGPVLGITGASLKIGMELSNDENGNDYDALGTTVEEFEANLGNQFTESLTAQSQMFSEIYADQGKLRAVAKGLRTDPAHWDLELKNSGRLVEAANSAATLSFWRGLIGSTYQRWEAKGAPTGDLDKWCIRFIGICLKPGSNLAAEDWRIGKNAYTYETLAPGLKYADGWDTILVGTNRDGTKRIRPMSATFMTGDAGDAKQVGGLDVASISRSGGYAPYVMLRWPMASGRVCARDLQANQLAPTDLLCSKRQVAALPPGSSQPPEPAQPPKPPVAAEPATPDGGLADTGGPDSSPLFAAGLLLVAGLGVRVLGRRVETGRDGYPGSRPL